jgi:hypothetical protein
MKWIVARSLSLFIVAIPVMVLAGSHGEVTTEHDEFTGQDSVILKNMDLGGQLYLFLFMKPSAKTVSVMLMYFANDWGFLKCHPIDWLIDGKPAPGPKTVHDGEVTSRGVTETITQELPVAFFTKIVAAETVKGRICTYEFSFSDDQRQTLRTFAETAKIKFK